MLPLSDTEKQQLIEDLSSIICKLLTGSPEMLGSALAVRLHLLRRHKATDKEAREVWATILMEALKRNGAENQAACDLLTKVESTTEAAVVAKVDDIIRRTTES